VARLAQGSGASWATDQWVA